MKTEQTAIRAGLGICCAQGSFCRFAVLHCLASWHRVSEPGCVRFNVKETLFQH